MLAISNELTSQCEEQVFRKLSCNISQVGVNYMTNKHGYSGIADSL